MTHAWFGPRRMPLTEAQMRPFHGAVIITPSKERKPSRLYVPEIVKLQVEELREQGVMPSAIAKRMRMSKNKVLGILWRLKHPK